MPEHNDYELDLLMRKKDHDRTAAKLEDASEHQLRFSLRETLNWDELAKMQDGAWA
ncbi:hypothetical protein PMZ80_002942 [Knufia obscura]|uniref:Uncharacterized protein n=1 Tax=Knufia obscura TaxID=1635080 RepID=A0ABR0RYS2_9EURO|nr:hypothetical protein PMZ80_002942 [Knufia obscura]